MHEIPKAIWVEVQQLHIRAVPLKSEQQRARLALHGMRSHLMKMRSMQTNALRGILHELGIVLPEGRRAYLQPIDAELVAAAARLPGMPIESSHEQCTCIQMMRNDIDQLDRRLLAVGRDCPQMRRFRQSLATVP